MRSGISQSCHARKSAYCTGRRKQTKNRAFRFSEKLREDGGGGEEGIRKWSISFSKLSKLSFCRRAGGFKCDHCLGMTLGNERRGEDRLRQGSRRVITKVVDAGSSFPPSNLQRTLCPPSLSLLPPSSPPSFLALRLSLPSCLLSFRIPAKGSGNGSWIRESETKRGGRHPG